MGTSVTTDTVTVKAVNGSSSSATDTDSASITNAVTNSDYNGSNSSYWASVSIGSGLSAGGGSATVSASAGHTHTYYYYYTSGSTSGPYTSSPSDSVTWSITSQTFTPSGGSASSISRFSQSGNTLSHTTMGTNVGTDAVNVRAVNSSSSSATKDASTSITNGVESISLSVTTNPISYNGTTTCSVTATYTSGSTADVTTGASYSSSPTGIVTIS